MATRYDALIAGLREAAQPDRPAPAAMRGYLEKVRLHAYRVTDRDIEALQGCRLHRGRDLRAHGLGRSPRRARSPRRRACERCDEARRRRRRPADDAARALGREPIGVLKTLYYRPEIFGRPFSDALDQAMRGPSDWTAGERELFAAFVSSLNQCPF